MRAPDSRGRAGRAWRLSPPTPEYLETHPDHQAGIVTWLLNVPGAHIAWSWWMLGAISLRDLPGVRPANKHYIGAEFEFMIYALNPERCPHPDPDQWEGGYPYLVPSDLVYQSHGLTEDQIRHVVALMVLEIVNGRMSPDQDYRESWKSLLATTITHFREGVHGC